MEETLKEIISHYKNYLNKKDKNYKFDMNNTSYKDIKLKEEKTKNELKILEDLSHKYKLYDENYNKFMISMGELSFKIENIDKINIDNENKKIIIDEFLNMHNSFEELEQINIMKDVYVWKFVSQKEKSHE